MIEMKFSKNDEEDGLFRISSRDIVGFYNCSSKKEINVLYLVLGKEKQKALRMLKEGKTKMEILKATGGTVAVKKGNLSINEGEISVIMGRSGSGKSLYSAASTV